MMWANLTSIFYKIFSRNESASSANFNLIIHGGSPLTLESIPNLGWSLAENGPIKRHAASLVEHKIEVMALKLHLIKRSYINIAKIKSNISAKYDRANNKLEVAEEYYDLILHSNYFFYEARAFLDILSRTLHALHGEGVPRSFNDLMKSEIEKTPIGNSAFRSSLCEIKKSDWIKLLLSNEKDSRISIRDLIAHESIIRISIVPDRDKNLEFKIHANNGASPPLISNKMLDLTLTIDEILKGQKFLFSSFKKEYNKDVVIGLLRRS